MWNFLNSLEFTRILTLILISGILTLLLFKIREDAKSFRENIGRASTSKELMDLAYMCAGRLGGLSAEESNIFLERAGSLYLTPEQWRDVYFLAETGSELKKVAKGQSRNYLETKTKNDKRPD